MSLNQRKGSDMTVFRRKGSIGKAIRTAIATTATAALAAGAGAQAAETIVYKYDARGRLIKVERTGTVNNNVHTTYGHDKANNRKTIVVTGSPNPAP
jgi:hypothetical protein